MAKTEATKGRLSASEIRRELSDLPGWKGTDRRRAITRTYRQPDFRSALAFVAWVGELAEAANHHPDIDVRYDRVTLTLSSHDAGGLTHRDFALARRIDHLG